MQGLHLLPPELVLAIIEECGQQDRCHLRVTCRTLKNQADPVVFRCLSLAMRSDRPHLTENQIIALATGISRACDLTKSMRIFWISDGLPASELSWPHFGHCEDLRVHLPSAISALRNLTCFRWAIADWEPSWLIYALIRAVADLPQLTEVTVETSNAFKAPIPLGLFSHLSKLTVACGKEECSSYFVLQLATAIANSPRLTALDVTYWGLSSSGVRLPSLSDLFMDLSPENPLCLEHLRIRFMNAEVDRGMLPHLAKLSSFQFEARDEDIQLSRRFWTSLLVNSVQLSEVLLRGILTEEALVYLSSFSGLKALDVDFIEPPPGKTSESFRRMLFAEVLPKHVDTLQKLRILGEQNENYWVFDNTNSTSILQCRRLRDLYITIDGERDGISTQYFIDTISQLPELKILRFFIINFSARKVELSDFKPTEGIRYVEQLQINWRTYVWEENGRYRRISL